MDKKYLFGMLLSGAMLAACTADDDLNLSPVAQDANSSAPVFNVRFDGDLQNRATYDGEKGMKVLFEAGDLLSLYHGFQKSGSDVSLDNAYQNAIYEGATVGTEGFEFTTKSMINPGNAILIYPADTTFQTNTGDEGVFITIETEQNEDTKKFTPYMSEILEIAARPEGGKNDSTAGYNKHYDIVLKRAASTLDLTLNLTDKKELPADVTEDYKVTKITLFDNEKKKIFTKKIKVVPGEAPVNYVANKAHRTWAAQSEYSATGVTSSGEGIDKISTTDLRKNKDDQDVATFTLLPTTDDNDAISAFRVLVNTNYGQIELINKTSTAEAPKVFTGGDGKKVGLYDGFNYLLKNDLWKKQTNTNSVFYKDENTAENVGFYLPRTLDVDMTILDMNNLHIENETHLINALKVYNALKDDIKTDEVTFLLDGEASGANKGKFVMHEAAWKAVMDQLSKEDNKVTFKACTTHTCGTIVLDNGNATATEIPELAIGEDLTLELSKNWVFTGPTKDPSVAANKTKYKALKGFNKIVVAADGVLELKNYINVNDVTTFALENEGTVNVNGDVYLQLTMTNKNIINISSKGDLSAQKSGASLTNNWAVVLNNKNQDIATGWDEGAVINVEGTLSAVKNGGGVVNNYGVINQKSATAKVMITTNGLNGSKISTKFSDTSRMGTIYLYENRTEASDERVTVDEEGVEGFIKVTLTDNNPAQSAIGKVANYIVVKGDKCEELTFGTTSATQTTAAKTWVPATVKYVEVNTENVEDVTFRLATDEKPTLNGLFVKAGSKVYIPNTVEIKLDTDDSAVFAEGKIDCPGTLTGYEADKLNNYFGDNKTAQTDNVKSYK